MNDFTCQANAENILKVKLADLRPDTLAAQSSPSPKPFTASVAAHVGDTVLPFELERLYREVLTQASYQYQI